MPVAGYQFRSAAVAGIIHNAAGPEHLAESPLLGWGMLATAAAQLAAAALLLVLLPLARRPSSW